MSALGVSAGATNAELAGQSVVLWPVENDYRVYLRRAEDYILEFAIAGDAIIDVETGSTWDMQRELAKSGPLAGQALQQVASSTAFDWARVEFYPDAKIVTTVSLD